MKSLSTRFFLLITMLACMQANAVPAMGWADMSWNEGAADCATSTQPPLEVHRYDARTYILRENPCATFEAPFMYLLIGSKRALLIDTGDVADPKKVPLAQTVIHLLPTNGSSTLPLLVLHTHGHLDHRRGDGQFKSLPNVQVVPTDLAHVKAFFGFADWPNGIAHIELGDRTVDVLPTPGHYPSHISFYDRNTGLFFSGDFLMPGRLIIDNTAADLASAQRVADFVKNRPVSAVLGGHIELDAQGNTFDFGSTYHPNEHVLPLSKDDLLAFPARVAKFNGFYTQDGMFVMFNQFRVLGAELGIVVLVLAAIVAAIWCFWRRRKRRRNHEAH
ncbi:MBL fold metallo-hydrolase [Dyella monticola]|uniref:MBL fold metallo-hydrolase n=1 Tax=Dyella monticola TaxID=1927958 RepID=A0A370WU61_9GAMM|nr:MBL fold metallo-hydrolase [Dyella monticola]RDS79547.1 MBL fold metallo-hydrolase [Dyella monticola]